MAVTFTRAKRKGKKFRLGIDGPTGAGKTEGALSIATKLAAEEGKRVAFIDTENGSASLYADRYDFDVIEVGPPYHTKKFTDGIAAAVEGGYGVCVIDSSSHQWDGEGGILQRKDAYDAANPGSNRWTNWAKFSAEHESFRKAILHSPIHVIVCTRSKMAYEQVEEGGKKKVVKLGLQPIQRDGMEYEYFVSFNLTRDHHANVSKDRTGVFEGGIYNLRDPSVAKAIIDWLGSAAPDEPTDFVITGGDHKGKRLGEVETDDLIELRATVVNADAAKMRPDQRTYATGLINNIDAVLARRERDRALAELSEKTGVHIDAATSGTAAPTPTE